MRGSEEPYLGALPYDGALLFGHCSHSDFYRIQLATDAGLPPQPPVCGLCFFREGWESELPTRLHLFKTLAENGNPETSTKLFAHLFLVMGLVAPAPDEGLVEFRRKRERPRGREQYTEAAWRLFPVASSLWKLMGYQPPLGIVLSKAVSLGRTERELSKELDLSIHNISVRMAKGIRTAVGYLPRAERHSEPDGAIARVRE